MKIISEASLKNFDFWGGAVHRAKALTDEQFEEIEEYLEEIFPDGINEAQLNYIFWFEDDELAQYLGFEDFEALEAHNEGEDDDDEDYVDDIWDRIADDQREQRMG